MAPDPAPPPPHWPALDGLRGAAVVAVVGYHLGYVHGGFVGVDVFFVLSGFLITSLLLRERQAAGRTDLRRFWARRARRLLPALGAALVGVVVAARVVFVPSRLPELRGDALATALYVANWRFAAKPLGGYFATTLPSPLRHAWSLAIEEQFYAAWPLVVVGVAWLAGRRRLRTPAVVGLAAAAGAVASTAWMVVHAGSWSTDRLYLGTDTRVAAPLVGAALAGLSHHQLTRRAAHHQRSGPGLALVGALPLVALLAAVLWASPDDGWLYRGGFGGVALVAAAAVLACTVGQALVVRPMSTKPLRWLGTHSYGLYLYSWPIQVFAAAEGLDGFALAATTIVGALVVATASYRWLELPIRRGSRRSATGAERAVSDRRAGGGAPSRPARPARRRRAPVVWAGTIAVVFGVIVAATATSARPSPLQTATDAQLHAEALHPVVTTAPAAHQPLRVLVAGDSVAYTLGHFFPSDLPGITVDSRGVTGCGLMTTGDRPPGIEKIGGPPTYDNCAEPEAEADRLGVAGHPEVVLFVTGAWERTDHQRDGRLVGPGDAGWTTYVKGLLQAKLDVLTSGGAKVALWSEPCGIDAEGKRREAWFTDDVLRPVAAARTDTVVIDPSPVVCRSGKARTDIPGVGSPRPDDGEHWSEAGAAWLWTTWLGPRLEHLAGR